jgi:alanine-synthesizing transaminase
VFKIPEFYQAMGSLEFTKKLIAVAKVGVSPGIGFGEYGDKYVKINVSSFIVFYSAIHI